jgi:hypothetical protein
LETHKFNKNKKSDIKRGEVSKLQKKINPLTVIRNKKYTINNVL